MKLNVTFTEDPKNTSSPAYQNLKKDTEKNLKKELKKTLPAIEDVIVTGFEKGSVVAKYDMIILYEFVR